MRVGWATNTQFINPFVLISTVPIFSLFRPHSKLNSFQNYNLFLSWNEESNKTHITCVGIMQISPEAVEAEGIQKFLNKKKKACFLKSLLFAAEEDEVRF